MSDTERFHRDLAAGVGLFNQQRYFDAHEVWEDRWRLESGEERRLLHGLIQLAAAFHQLIALRSPVGFTRLLDKALPKLRSLGERCCGVAVGPLVSEAASWHSRVAAWKKGALPELDETPLPRILRVPPPEGR